MKLINNITIHSARENDDRTMILDWCNSRFEQGTWHLYSDYRTEGCFSVIVSNAIDAELYILTWGGFILDITYQSTQILQIDEETFDRVFEINVE